MKTQLKLFLFLAFAGIGMLVLSQASWGQNLITDPGFEIGTVTGNPNTTDALGWASFGGTPYEGTNDLVDNPTFMIPPGGQPTVPHSGVWDMEMPGGGGGFSVPGAYQIFQASAGQTYTFSSWVRTPNVLVTGSNDFAITQIQFYDGPSGGNKVGPAVGTNFGTPSGGGGIALPQNTWEFGSVTATAPAGTGSIGVYLLNINANSNAYFAFDDTSLTLATSPAPPAPGDYNKDGHVDVKDIGALLLALANIDLYKTTYNVSNADLAAINNLPNNSGSSLDNSKIATLEADLIAGDGTLSAVPEPSTLLLSVLAFGSVLLLKRRAASQNG